MTWNGAAIALYLIKCAYLLMSAWHIRNGYPSVVNQNILTENYGLARLLILKMLTTICSCVRMLFFAYSCFYALKNLNFQHTICERRMCIIILSVGLTVCQIVCLADTFNSTTTKARLANFTHFLPRRLIGYRNFQIDALAAKEITDS